MFDKEVPCEPKLRLHHRLKSGHKCSLLLRIAEFMCIYICHSMRNVMANTL